MSYLDFLLEPYNLVYLASLGAGGIVLLWARAARRDLFRVHAGLIALGIAGLTVNGAVHDLRLGDPGELFVRSALVALVLAALGTVAAGWIRDRFFPPIREVAFNERGLEGVEAKVVSRRVEADPGSGRAQWHDGDRVLHLVACHTSEASVGFGRTVRLEEYDDEHDSYRVRPV